MTNLSFNSNPNELTSFDGGSSPESSGTFFKYILEFVRPSTSSAALGGNEVVRDPSPEIPPPNTALARKVTPFEGMFNKSGSKPNIPVSKSDADTSNDFKRYWMPDDQCKECYECSTLFTTFKRRHHCRLCGQIFCYDCCSDVISGKIAGCGDAEIQLRVCKYCLESKSKHQKIERKRRPSTNKGLIFSSPTLDPRAGEPDSPGVDPFSDYLQEELKEEDVQKINQHFMWSLFRSPNSTIPIQPSWYRLRYFSEAYQEGDVMNWLAQHLQKPEDAASMLNAWIDTNRLEPINPGKTIFKVGARDDYNENTVMLYEQIKKEPEKNSTNWIHRMIQEAKASSQSFEVQTSSGSSFVHVDVDKDLDEEYWQSSEATLNTSQSLDDTIGMELNRLIDSMNFTAKMLLKGEHQVDADMIRNADHFGIEMLNQCVMQEKSPNPSLNIPPFAEVPDLELQSRSMERRISNLTNIYDDHLDSILDTLIDKEKISTSWRVILKKLVSEAANDVSPNPMNGDSMDIRKYVKFKKLHGQPEESSILDGYVLTKTIAHKKMQSHITNPKIMLLNGSISYQRVLNKLTSLNPVFLQEKEFLTKVVDRVASFEPDVLIVEKSVSQIAKDELLNKGITLILNLKQGQIEKIARNVQGDIIQNLENVTFIPVSEGSNSESKNKLGHCKEFRADFMKGFYGANKPVLFFTGCDKNLTKTILLRDENKIVLKKVKKVASYYLYALYNRRLEFNYLKRSKLYWKSPHSGTRSNSQASEAATFVSHSNAASSGHNSPLPEQHLEPSPGCSVESDTSEILFLGTSPSNFPPIDHDDISDDESLVGSPAVAETEKQFEELVSTTLFSVTPFCRPTVPYLCTELGNNCPTRGYFDEQMYFSSQLLSPDTSKLNDPLSSIEVYTNGDIVHSQSLSPTKPIITSFNADDLAFYRAFGYWEFEKDNKNRTNGSILTIQGEECHPEAPYHIQSRFEQNMRGKDIDCLDFYHHQKLLVLFSSLSVKSFNHPHPCISPWSLNMQFYGKNDLTLGLFLRDYCYLSTYVCPDQSCKTVIVDHERRFVHNGQSVNLKMSKLSSVLESISNTPIMWSVCTKCLFMSEISIVSKETWNYSFAKFLELKFYENCLHVKGSCPHSYHRYHTNFFALGNIVACFTRTDVRIAEVCPLFSRYNFEDKFTDITVSNGVLLNETVTKINTALKVVHDKIEDMSSGCEETVIKEAEAKVATEDTTFKQKISEICEMSSTLSDSPIEVRRSIYRIQSELVFCIDQWNKYLADIKRRPKASSTTASKQTIYASSELLNDTPDESPNSSFCPKPSTESEKITEKYHRRVHSDTSVEVRQKVVLTKTLSEHGERALHRSLDDILSSNKTVKSCETVKSNDTKVAELKHSESRYSKMASSTKKFFKALTDSYKKIEPSFPVEEHHRITGGSRPTVLVNEKHFTSIVAYALSCDQYRAKLQLLKPGSSSCGGGSSSATHTPDHDTSNNRTSSQGRQPSHVKSFSGTYDEEDKVGHWLTVTSNGSGEHGGSSGDGKPTVVMSHLRQKSADLMAEESVINKSNHIDVEFYDGPTKFFCKIYFAAEFDKLRNLLMPGEALNDFIHSLSYCNKWRAKGGKSGLAFSKTQDDRWVVKEMSRLELQALLMFMPNYVEYVMDSIDKRPTLLAKIIGACTVGFNNSHTGISLKQDVIIMENIFFNVTPSVVYDLKGSVRNRKAEECDEVLLDENYLHHIVDNPVYLRPHSKTFLREAVNCDTAFLAAQSIIDYSLLVGTCGEKIVVGIIDYIRKFTFDKKVEMIFKTNMIGSAGKMPTIVSPEMYRERFCNQIERYFPLVPDKWTGMGSDLQYS